DAFDIIASKYENIKLVITGKSGEEEKQSVLKRIAISPYKDRIEILGYLDDDDYYKALNAADVLCMTRIDSGYSNAGFPFKLGEYLATGKPVVASNVSDVGRLLKNQKEVLLTTPGDVTSLVSQIQFILNNPKESLIIGSRGRVKAIEIFDYQKQGESLLQYLYLV
ncbi:MAG TPA: glycosyltransferase, partial [Ignavibacteria bacterium]|nr:glycosyltransferase [Ignavibacteria bacterium]